MRLSFRLLFQIMSALKFCCAHPFDSHLMPEMTKTNDGYGAVKVDE